MQNGTSAKGHASVTAKTFAVLKKDDLQNMVPIFSNISTQKEDCIGKLFKRPFLSYWEAQKTWKSYWPILWFFLIVLFCSFWSSEALTIMLRKLLKSNKRVSKRWQYFNFWVKCCFKSCSVNNCVQDNSFLWRKEVLEQLSE